MTFRDVIGQDRSSVPWHEHDAADISGEGVFTDLTVDRLLSGTINSKTIIVAGGTDGLLRSDNFSTGVSGWMIDGSGAAEFHDVTVRGEVAAGGDLRSPNYVAGTSGWIIEGDGNAEFNDVTLRGVLYAFDSTGAGVTIDPDDAAGGWIGGAPAITFTADAGTRQRIEGLNAAIGVTVTNSIPETVRYSLAAEAFVIESEDSAWEILNFGFTTLSQPTLTISNGSTGASLASLGYLGLRVGDGSVSAPTIGFLSDADTGLFRLADDTSFDGGVGITHNGVLVAGFEKNGNASKITLGEFNDWIEYDTDLEEFHVVISNSRRFTVSTSYFGAAAAYNVTTTAAANVFVENGGQIKRSTSSARYKRVIRPYFRANGESVLELEPSTFYSKADGDDPDRQYLGLIAEDVAERFPLAAIRDEKGRPDAVDWNAITAALLAEIRSLRARVDALEAAA